MAIGSSRLRLHPRVQDLLLAAFVTATHLLGTLQLAPNQEDARPLAEPGQLGFVLLTLTGVVLAVRRRWPVAVFLTVVAGGCTYYLAGYPDGPAWLALFVAAYTLTSQGDGRRSLQIAAAGLTVLAVVSLASADLQPLLTAGWVFFRIGTAVMAAALGESVRSRRVIATEAQDRAERAERTREEEARRRVDAERLRIAREVHDTVAHAIAIINVQAGVTAHVLDKRPAQARETLVTIEQTSARALRELRATLGVLRDGDEGRRAPTGCLDALDELTAMAQGAGLDAKVEVVSPLGELPRAVDSAAYRILQESITNVIRHAGPTRVTIVLDQRRDRLELRVTNEAQTINEARASENVPARRGPRAAGEDTAAGVQGGQGLVGMRERCALLGGKLTAGPRPEGGFEVRAYLPFEPTLSVRTTPEPASTAPASTVSEQVSP